MNINFQTTFFIVFLILNVAAVSMVYYYNRHPYGTLDQNHEITSEELFKKIYEETKKMPDAYTYDKLTNGKYVIYKYNGIDKYDKSIGDYPVDTNGEQWKTQESIVVVEDKTGISVTGISNILSCPQRWHWDKSRGTCVQNTLCPNGYDNSILPLLDAYYADISNPAITMHTSLTGHKIHPQLYIECSKRHHKPIIQECSENTFVKISTETFDEKFVSNIPAFGNGAPNVAALCKRFDVCAARPDGSVHRFLPSDDEKPLESNEYYLCEGHISQRRECSSHFELNPNFEYGINMCIPTNHCATSGDFYFHINNHTYGYCKSHMEHVVSCPDCGIFNMQDGTIECRNAECLKPNDIIYYNDVNFHYPYAIKSCFSGNTRTELTCDDMLKKLNQFPNIPDIYLSAENIIDLFTPLYGDKTGKIFEKVTIQIPTKFYYDLDKQKCVLFDKDTVVDVLKSKNMIQKKIIIYKSSAFGMYKLPFLQENGKPTLLLNPEYFSVEKYRQIYVMYKGVIYTAKDDDNYQVTKFAEISTMYCSFITPIFTKPRLLPTDDHILHKFYNSRNHIIYGLCVMYDVKLKFTVSSLPATYESLFDNPFLSMNRNFPTDSFQIDKVYVGKYFFDKNNSNFIIYHDYLIVIHVNPEFVHHLNIDKTGQFIVDDFMPRRIADIYDTSQTDINGRKFYKTALITTFNYFGAYFEKPVPYWLSFINVNYNDLMDTNKYNNYFKLLHPIVNEETAIKILNNIINMNDLEIEIRTSDFVSENLVGVH